MSSITGLHHVSVIAGDPQQTLDFYVAGLGMRLVKRTVNQDAPDTYHFFFADGAGSPGTELTFFPWPNMPHGRAGHGLTTAVALAVPPGVARLLGGAAGGAGRRARPARNALRRALASLRRPARPGPRARRGAGRRRARVRPVGREPGPGGVPGARAARRAPRRPRPRRDRPLPRRRPGLHPPHRRGRPPTARGRATPSPAAARGAWSTCARRPTPGGGCGAWEACTTSPSAPRTTPPSRTRSGRCAPLAATPPR
jgi:catechol 2,3-dioxygenase-like lactoylglutathione lyase family enzyme